MSVIRPAMYFLVLLYVLLSSSVTSTAVKEICNHWSSIARRMTRANQNCTAGTTPECTKLDCSSSDELAHLPLIDASIEIDYCFGVELRSCNNPKAIDFYLQVPSKNYSDTVRFTEDTSYAMKDLKVKLGPLGHAFPEFTFSYETNEDSSIVFSIIVDIKVKPVFGGEFDSGIKKALIDRETIHPMPCLHMTTDSSGKPPSNFGNGTCGPGSYKPPATPKPESYTPSHTLYKVCGIMKNNCSTGELCDLSLKPPQCLCKPDSTLSPKNDSCLSSAKLHKQCRINADCGFNEECDTKTRICECKHGYSYSDVRDMCVFSHSGKPSDVQPPAVPLPPTKKPQAPKTDDDKDDSDKGKHNLPIYIGSAVAAVVAIALAIWGILYLKRHRNRGSSDSEARVPMLGNEDDNMIM